MEDVGYERRRAEVAAGESRRAADVAQSYAGKASVAADDAVRAARKAEESACGSKRLTDNIIKNLRADLEASRKRELQHLKLVKDLTIEICQLKKSLQNSVINTTEKETKDCLTRPDPVVEKVSSFNSYFKSANHN